MGGEKNTFSKILTSIIQPLISHIPPLISNFSTRFGPRSPHLLEEKCNMKILKSWYFYWILIGVLVRVLLSIFTLHPDIWGISLTPSFLAFEGVWNIYDYLGSLNIEKSAYAQNLGNTFNTADIFIYPPLAYFTLGFFTYFFSIFNDPGYFQVVVKNLEKTLGDPALFRYLFFAKLPYFFFDFAALYFLVKMFKEEKQKRTAFFLWLFNPVLLYTTYMIGNFDVIPVFFTVIGTYFFVQKKYWQGFLLFGIGAAYKTYPILLALPLIFLFGETQKRKLAYFLLLIGPYVLTSLPFLTTIEYRRDVLFNPKNTKFLFMSLPVSGAEVLYVFIVGLVAIVLTAAYRKTHMGQFWIYPLAILLLFLSVTHYHPQWALWAIPFLILLWVSYQSYRWLLVVLLLLYVGIVFTFEASLSYSLFGPLFPASHNLPSLTAILTDRFDPVMVNQMKSFLRSVFAGVSLWLIVSLLFRNHTTQETTQ